ncbi:hypothetical protein GCM10022381_02300 [Leifsonia kafniensis]|uniref:5,10-methylene-tetrahydrofolate dehydrogenase n=1 Tax=Leifsonia kafniensis TaxID=475957 RepID=A0ABP7K2F9_9MICO
MNDSRETIVVGFIADPGLPIKLAERFQKTLPASLAESVDSEVEWRVQVVEFSLPLNDAGVVELNKDSALLRDQWNWDYVVYLTDLPKYVENEPLISSANVAFKTGMIVLPSLGVVRSRRLKRALLEVLAALHGAEATKDQRRGKDSLTRRALYRETDSDTPHDQDTFETVKGFLGRLLLQAGMVRSNRPWRLLPQLSSAMAAAIAAGAFGIFYTSIWSMADFASPWRLFGISILSIAILSTWLMVSNSLWERPRGGLKRERQITYNVATATTLVVAVASMYVGLFVVILAGSLMIINSGFMAQQLGHEVGFADYVNLSWLSASLGTMAGALGSSLENKESVRRATFSSREYERRQTTIRQKIEKMEPSEGLEGEAK